MKNFPILYKKTSTGAIQQWEISVDGKTIITQYGQVGGAVQRTEDTIKSGKNEGKANATTAEEQAVLEAQAKHTKQLKKGYVGSPEAAEAGEIDEVIEGGVVPMLAHKFSEQGHKIKYPCYVQPKLDGIRMIAIVKDGVCTLWSRTRKPIMSLPHIQRRLEANFPSGEIVLDGEAYSHEHKSDFEKIVSMVRQQEPAPGHEIIEYYVYDLVKPDCTFEERYSLMTRLPHMFAPEVAKALGNPVVLVPTWKVESQDALMESFTDCIEQGYEGCMARQATGKYVNKRSYDLQKVKSMLDDEFEIIGIEEGRGKLAGHVGAFICLTKEGKDFKATPKGDTGKKKQYFEDHSLWKGKKLTVQYQNFTADGRPRFTVGLRIRDSVDF